MTNLQTPSRTAAPSTAPDPGRRSRRFMARAVAFLLTIVVVLVGLLLVALAMAGSQTAESTAAAVVSITAESGTSAVEPTATVAEPTTTVAAPVAAVADAAGIGLTDVSDVVADVVDSVVRIEITAVVRGREVVMGSGSGVIIDSEGTIVTNAHVVEAGSGINVVLADETSHPATVLGVDSGSDVAVVSIEATGLTAIEFGSTGDLLVGDPVIAVGHPLGLEGSPSVSSGIVSALDRILEDTDVSLTGIIQTDAAITEGSSGGALLDSSGRLIGITTAVGVSSVGIEGMGFAIPVETITGVSSQLTGI